MHKLLTLSLLALLLPACSNVRIWPFGDDQVGGNSGRAGAIEYQCEGGKRLLVRSVDNGAAVWLILPDREVRLDKSGSGNRYGNGIAVLDLEGGIASLKDGDTVTHAGCKLPQKSE